MIRLLVKDFRLRLFLQFETYLILAISFFSLLFFYYGINPVYLSVMIPIIILLTSFLFLRSKNYQRINGKNIVEHINRNNSDYQESAQLLLSENKLPEIQQIQKIKIQQRFELDYNQNKFANLMPKFNLKLLAVLIAANSVLLSVGKQLPIWTSELVNHFSSVQETTDLKSDEVLPKKINHVEGFEILVSPPAYTGVVPYRAQELSFEALEGSNIKWSLNFLEPDGQYFYSFSGRESIPINQIASSKSFHHTIEQTFLYRFSHQYQGKLIELPDVFSVTMIKDKTPRIKITQPLTSLVEINKNDPPTFTLEAHVSDDYGISQIKVLASVAKGSGEAVKFRDKVFYFTPSEMIKPLLIQKERTHLQSYRKTWSLHDLDMSPGDEVYLNVQATDNKEPLQQNTKSQTIIVKWLDEEPAQIAAEGLQIHFVPEYFRSQRQIILETEQLIADKNDLNRASFNEMSVDLSHSQRDLKEKYGQYLGDEIGEGIGDHHGLADGYHGGEEGVSGEASAGITTNEHKDNDQHQENNEHNSLPESQHESHTEASDDNGSTNDLSGATELISQFTHHHTSIEVGPLSNRDPKTWMKMSVNEMWQSELHLALSRPEKALPFAYKAYDYLKRARQAERIYAQRLGFEPPPVSEDRRYAGELADILQYQKHFSSPKQDINDSQIYTNGYRVLNQTGEPQLSDQQREIFKKLSERLLELSENRPALISYAITSEKLSQAQWLKLTKCDDCLSKLKAKLWQLLPEALAIANTKNKRHSLLTEIELSYDKAIKTLSINND